MEIDSINYFSNLPPEVLEKVFQHLDGNFKLKNCFLELGKRIHEFVFDTLMTDLKIPFNSAFSSYSQVINHYKIHCLYFYKLLPDSFSAEERFSRTVISTKIYVDSILAMPCETPCYSYMKTSILEEAWHAYSQKLPINHSGGGPICKNPIKVTEETNKEIQIFLAAGAHCRHCPADQGIIEGMIKQKECSPETIKMLIQYGYRIKTETIVKAVYYGRCKEILPDMMNAVAYDNALTSLIREMPSQGRYLIEDKKYLGKFSTISEHTLTLALEKDYNEAFILEILEKCNETSDFSLKFALERSSEKVISQVLEKCPKIFSWGMLNRGIRRHCDASILMEILDKLEKINPTAIEFAEKRGYSQNMLGKTLLEKMRNKPFINEKESKEEYVPEEIEPMCATQ